MTPGPRRRLRPRRGAGHDVRTVGRKGDYLALKRVEHFRHKQIAEVHVGGEIFEVHMPLAGDFQISNALVAAGLAMSTGIPAKAAMAALEKLQGASGRLELVGHTKGGALAYVDYAHKPDALENVLSSVRPFTTGRVVVVFGCGGDRDKGKRPIMGEIATRLADVVIVTDDNPRSEVPADHSLRDHGGGPRCHRDRRPRCSHPGRCRHAAIGRYADRCRQGTRRGPDRRLRDIAVLGSCRTQKRIGRCLI